MQLVVHGYEIVDGKEVLVGIVKSPPRHNAKTYPRKRWHKERLRTWLKKRGATVFRTEEVYAHPKGRTDEERSRAASNVRNRRLLAQHRTMVSTPWDPDGETQRPARPHPPEAPPDYEIQRVKLTGVRAIHRSRGRNRTRKRMKFEPYVFHRDVALEAA